MKNIFIVGGDGFAREVYFHLQNLAECNKEIRFGGFLGHNGYGCKVDYKDVQHLYIGEVSEYTFRDNDYCIIGAGDSILRKKIYDDIKSLGGKFWTLIAKGIYLADSFIYGEANIFIPPFYSTVNIDIGDGNLCNGNVSIGHDCKIGNFNTFLPSSCILGNVRVGDYNSIGTNAIILPKAKIGNHNIICPLSVIYKGCGNNLYMFGNPAIKIGEVK
ncbi:hypothetical protein [Helicobacter sp. 16-1353]|uniref:hypothetical protein n=1 Tax=Helicobacter sp. 16-1353 TaxID=2004996 RepID=UPI0015EF1113|nr:hypothetical protein [Helicobacter sp. 16-1353]